MLQKENAERAEARAREEIAEAKARIARDIIASVTVGQLDRAEQLARILANLLA